MRSSLEETETKKEETETKKQAHLSEWQKKIEINIIEGDE
jgi:hypothetical protein